MNIQKATLWTIGILTTLIGGWDLSIQVLLILMGADIFTGILKALFNCKFTSKAFRQGLVNKAGFIVVIIICYQLDVLVGNTSPVIREICTIFYITIEGSSIVENLGVMGVPIPNFIKTRLEQLKDLTNEGKKEE